MVLSILIYLVISAIVSRSLSDYYRFGFIGIHPDIRIALDLVSRPGSVLFNRTGCSLRQNRRVLFGGAEVMF